MHGLVLLMIAPWLAATAGAQAMTDPTRPPGAQSATGEAQTGPVLQSVMLSPARKVAVISGQVVPLGGRYGEARLVRLSESEAVLRNGTETTVLRLYPQVEKRAVRGTQSGNARKNAADRDVTKTK